MRNILDFLNVYFFGPALPIIVFCAGAYLFIKFGYTIFKKPSCILKTLFRKNEKDGISPIKSVVLALASTLGVGNIVGVSTAIFCGGAGAVFWLNVSAFAAMILKYSEVVLAVKYRTVKRGEYRGGAMYYMQECIKSKKLAVLFAFLCITNALCVGNVVQIKAVSESLTGMFGINPLYVGIVGCFVIFISIKNGTGRVAEITSKIIPIATLSFCALSFYVISVNSASVPSVVGLVLKEAFNIKALFGGVGGYSIISALRFGVARGIMSNEAGSGTSPIAHAKTNLQSSVEQGMFGIFEVFADTVLMCNLTAFAVLFSYNEYVLQRGLSGMDLVIAAYGRYAGKFGEYIIIISVILFAYATVACQGFYGRECVSFLSEKKGVLNFFTVVYCLFTVYGSVVSSELLWSFTDVNVSLMTLINTLCILAASGEIKRDTVLYFAKLKTGAEKPPFEFCVLKDLKE